MPVLHALDVPRTGETADADAVFAIRRKVVLDQEAPARAERHPVDVAVLIEQRIGVVNRAVELGLRIADGHLADEPRGRDVDRKSTRLNSSHVKISYAVFCLKKKNRTQSMLC